MRKLRDRRGSAGMMLMGVAFSLMMLTLLLIEMGSVYENYDRAETLLQRNCNSAVEKNIDDAFRADRILRLDTEAAEEDFRSGLLSGLPETYRVYVASLTAGETPPELTVTGTVTFPTLFSPFGRETVTLQFRIRSENVRLE